MAYKYEDKINEAFFTASRDGRNVNRELLAELQEVYRKAKAFNEISQVFKKVTIYNTATALEVKEILDKLEDTNNE